MGKRYNTDAIIKEIYPLVEYGMKNNYIKWKHVISEFIQFRTESLFDIAPCDRIYYTDKDREKLFAALQLTPKDIKVALTHTYYHSIDKFRPLCAKDYVTIVCLCIVRYFILNKQEKDIELAMIYLSFSGKLYPSIHFEFFRVTAPSKYRHIMEYVVNYKLNQKFDLKSTGSVIGAIKNVNATWVESYRNRELVSFEDEDITYILQQLRNRIKSFIKNIASLYYEAYKSKEYITYDKDALPEEEGGMYHLTTNDSFKLQKFVEMTMEKINTSQVNYAFCKQAADANVKADEVKNIMEAILTERENISKVKEFITLNIAYFLSNSEVKEVNSIYFLQSMIRRKPNSKDPSLIRIGELEQELLDDSSVGYRKRKHREPTKQSYHKALSMYFALVIIKANQ